MFSNSSFRRSLSLRMTVGYALIFMITTGLILNSSLNRFSKKLKNRDQEISEIQLNHYVNLFHERDLDELVVGLEHDRNFNAGNGFFTALVDRDGRLLQLTMPRGWIKPGSKRVLPFLKRSGANEIKVSKRNLWGKQENDDRLVLFREDLDNGAFLYCGYSARVRRDTYLDLRESLFRRMLQLSIVGLLIGYWAARRTLKPIRALRDTIMAVEGGQMGARVELARVDSELVDLADQFNRLLDRLEKLITGLRQTLDNVAHDLRTPLTRMSMALERVLTRPAEEPELREALQDCAEDAANISAMLKTMLDISEAETGTLRLELSQIEVSHMLEDLVELYSYLAEAKEIDFRLELTPVTLNVDVPRMKRVLANLIDNAIKFTAAGGQVVIRTSQSAEEVLIEICDNGCGIDPAETAQIFERLYRCDSSRSERGQGLGLSLVRAVVEAHGGHVSVVSQPGRGSTFGVHLPA